MKQYAVWIDMAQAKLFEMNPEGAVEKVIKRHEIRHHNGVEKEQNNRKNTQHFFTEVTGALQSADEVLLMGPAEAKIHFKEYLKNKVVGVETVDHPTDNQIVAHAKEFFRVRALAKREMNFGQVPGSR